MITVGPYPEEMHPWRVWTLTEPWATLFVIGAKWNETRSRALRVKGPVLIHAAKGFPAFARDLCEREPFATDLANAGIRSFLDFTLGHIVGGVTLVGMCFPTGAHGGGQPSDTLDAMRGAGLYHGPNEMAYGDYSPGRYAIPGRNPQRCEPIGPVRGSLGLWRWNGKVSWQKAAPLTAAI